MKCCLKKYNNLLFYVIAVLLYVGMIFFTYKCEMNPYFTFDEAGQFWIAQGLNHDSPPMSERGNLLDVVINNRNYNLDPGGYGQILHLWTSVSQNYIWLRSLSMVFFIFVIFALGYLGYRWTGEKYIAVLAGFVPFVVPLLYHYGFFLRAYSMEVLGCMACVIALYNLNKGITHKKLIAYSILISFFLTSRYSFFIVAFVTSLYVLYLIYNSSARNKEKWMMAVAYSLPLAVMIIVIYFLALRYQNPELQPLTYYLPYIYSAEKINWNVLCTRYTFRHFIYLAIIIKILYNYKNHEIILPYKGLLVITFATTILLFLFSCIGAHPWCPSHCVSMEVLIVVSITAFGCELAKRLNDIIDVKYLILAIFLLAFSYYKEDYEKIKCTPDVLKELRQINPTKGRVYVDNQESPFVRYLFEYGEFRNSPNYPQEFTFVPYRKHGFNTDETIIYGLDVLYNELQPSMEELYDSYDILVASEYYRFRPQYTDKWKSVNDRKAVWIKNN